MSDKRNEQRFGIRSVMSKADKNTGKLTPSQVNKLCSTFIPEGSKPLVGNIGYQENLTYGWYNEDKGQIKLTLTYPGLLESQQGITLESLLTNAKELYGQNKKLSEMRFILPIKGHYIYVEIDSENKQIRAYDSFPATVGSTYKEAIAQKIPEMEKITQNNELTIDYISTGMQGNVNACGYYAAQALYFKANNQDVPKEDALTQAGKTLRMAFHKLWIVFNSTFKVSDYQKRETLPSSLKKEFIQKVDNEVEKNIKEADNAVISPKKM